MLQNILKTEREKACLSLSELSKITGISKSTLQRYETGTTKKIPIEAIPTIERALKLRPGALMGWTDEPQPQNSPTESGLEEREILYRYNGKTVKKRMPKETAPAIVAMLDTLPEDSTAKL